METKCKFFSELTTRELYEIMRVRVGIFIVEQNCIYQELDGRDYDSLHFFFEPFMDDGIPHVKMVLKEG